MNDVNQKEEIQTINEFVMLCGALILAKLLSRLIQYVINRKENAA